MATKKRATAKRATAKRATAKRGTAKRGTARPAVEAKTMSAKAAAIEYLRKRRGPQEVKVVIAHVLDDPRVTGLKGATPAATIAAQIYVEAKKADGQIEKVGRGTVQYRGE
jgi:hypothetical protein